MASKGQKFKKYTIEEKIEITNKYLNGVPSRELGRLNGISYKTIENWAHILKYKSTLSGKGGRPKNGQDIDYKERYEILKKFQAFLKEQREKK